MGRPTSWNLRQAAQPLAVVAHDAGAANLIAAALRAEDVPHRAFVAGPAASIWRDLPRAERMASLDETLDGAGMLVTGTGWSSDLEHLARAGARSRRLFNAAVIDHWVNYKERFVRNGLVQLPDEVWVTDAMALAEAHRALPGVAALEKINYYLREQAEAVGPIEGAGDLLFVAEPARDDWGRGVPGEFQTLDYLMRHRAALGISAATPLRVRPHPSDPPGKYDAWILAHPGTRLDDSPDIASAMRPARWVAGLQSYALVVADSAGRVAVTALPPWAPPCPLPLPRLVHLSTEAGE